MDSEELNEIITKSKNDIDEIINKQNLGLDTLEQFLGAEKEQKNRKTVKKLLQNYIISKKLLQKINRDKGSFNNINSIQSGLDDINEVKKLNSLSNDCSKVEVVDHLFGTVKEFKDYAEDLELNSEDAELLLKVEISGKNREGVKNYLKDRIDYFRDGKDEQERKRDLKRELNLDVSEKLLEKVSVSKLEKIKKERNHRETLISDISEEADESPERLRKVSTPDLEKIASEIAG